MSFESRMLRLIVLVVSVASLNSVLTAKTCKENEEYEECPNRVCREKKCTDLGYPLACQQLDLQNVTCGRPSCICQAGYVRNKHGVCVLNRDCPSCGGDKNAWSGCGRYCTNCANYKSKENNVCILLCLSNSCDCRPGYLYDGIKKKCVLPEQCSCGPNEVRSECVNSSCVIEYCSQKDLNIKCTPNKHNCKPGCLCAEGYLRNERGVCIPKEKCPRKCGPNEVYKSCGISGCGKWNCSQVAEPILCIDVLPDSCQGDCVCADGYLRNAAGKCVPISKCPSKEICPKAHETYDPCPPDNCPPRTCETGNINTLVACKSPSNPADCVPTCVCEEGYYRDSKGDCVTLEECVSDNSYCLLAYEVGLCNAAFPKYYYNSSTKDCELFSYGGCGGNKNNFDTKEACLAKCSSYNV